MADWTAITGIVVAGVVGPIATSTIGSRLASRRAAQEHEYARILGDRDELRKFLDETAYALSRAIALSNALNNLLLAHGRRVREEAGEHLEELREALRTVQLNTDRLVLRLGQDRDATRAYDKACDSLIRAYNAVTRTPDGADDLAHVHAELALAASDFKPAFDLFMEEAHRLAAIQVEPRKQSRRARTRGRNP